MFLISIIKLTFSFLQLGLIIKESYLLIELKANSAWYWFGE